MESRGNKKERLIAAVLAILLVITCAGVVTVKGLEKHRGSTYIEENTDAKKVSDTEEKEVSTTVEDFELLGKSTAPQQTETPSVTEENEYSYEGDYVLPQSNTMNLEESDLIGLTKKQLSIARNEIYARHGRMFDSAELQAYFDSKDWYVPKYSPSEFSDNLLNEIEKKNAGFISKYEEQKNE